MNAEKAAKRSTNGHGAASAPETQASHTPSSAADAAAPAKSRSLKPLLGLAHFVARYKGKLILAGLGLVLGGALEVKRTDSTRVRPAMSHRRKQLS